MSILETKGLYHDFKGLAVLFDVNLEVKEGERHAIIGPNGTGKTTLFNVITGTYKPSKGGSSSRAGRSPVTGLTSWRGWAWDVRFRSPPRSRG